MGDIWEAEAKRLEPTQGMWSHFAAFQAWLNRCNQGLSEFNTEKLTDLEQVDLYTLFLAVANDRTWGANVPTFPEVQTDAERLAMAVLKGDTLAALALADLVSEEWKARNDAEAKGEQFVNRQELIDAKEFARLLNLQLFADLIQIPEDDS